MEEQDVGQQVGVHGRDVARPLQQPRWPRQRGHSLARDRPCMTRKAARPRIPCTPNQTRTPASAIACSASRTTRGLAMVVAGQVGPEAECVSPRRTGSRGRDRRGEDRVRLHDLRDVDEQALCGHDRPTEHLVAVLHRGQVACTLVERGGVEGRTACTRGRGRRLQRQGDALRGRPSVAPPRMARSNVMGGDQPRRRRMVGAPGARPATPCR